MSLVWACTLGISSALTKTEAGCEGEMMTKAFFVAQANVQQGHSSDILFLKPGLVH